MGIVFFAVFRETVIKKDRIIIKNTEDDICLGSYINLKVSQKKITVSKKEVDLELEHRLLKFADTKTVEEGRIQSGDIVTIDLKEEKSGDGDEYQMRIGDNEIDGTLDNMLLGMKNKEENDVMLENNRYHMQIKKIERFIYPKLTDAFVKGKLKCKTFTEYEEKVRQDVIKMKREREEEEVEKIDGIPPKIVIDNILMEVYEHRNGGLKLTYIENEFFDVRIPQKPADNRVFLNGFYDLDLFDPHTIEIPQSKYKYEESKNKTRMLFEELGICLWGFGKKTKEGKMIIAFSKDRLSSYKDFLRV